MLLCLSLSRSVSVSVCLCVCVSVSLYVCVCRCMCVCVPVWAQAPKYTELDGALKTLQAHVSDLAALLDGWAFEGVATTQLVSGRGRVQATQLAASVRDSLAALKGVVAAPPSSAAPAPAAPALAAPAPAVAPAPPHARPFAAPPAAHTRPFGAPSSIRAPAGSVGAHAFAAGGHHPAHPHAHHAHTHAHHSHHTAAPRKDPSPYGQLAPPVAVAAPPGAASASGTAAGGGFGPRAGPSPYSSVDGRLASTFSAAAVIRDADGLRFWQHYLGNATQTVQWEPFFHRLQAFMGAKLSAKQEDHLQLVLDHAGARCVTAQKFGEMLDGFGPGVGAAVARVHEAMAETWFHGFLSYEEAVEVLRVCSPGAFLIRFSQSSPCAFALAYIAADRTIQQVIIDATPSGFVTGGRAYTSLSELVYSHRNVLLKPAPNSLRACKVRPLVVLMPSPSVFFFGLLFILFFFFFFFAWRAVLSRFSDISGNDGTVGGQTGAWPPPVRVAAVFQLTRMPRSRARTSCGFRGRNPAHWWWRL